jgi:transcriptional regulator with XRE-family HTH domain
MEHLELREAIRHLREALGFTQEVFAWRMGVTVRTIAKWESSGLKSLPPNDLIHLRHVAIEAEAEDLAAYFDELFQATGCDECSATVHVYEFLPGNSFEMTVVMELLRRLRKGDPAIEPILRGIYELWEQHRAEVRAEVQAERERREAQPNKSASLRDRILAAMASRCSQDIDKSKAKPKRKE